MAEVAPRRPGGTREPRGSPCANAPRLASTPLCVKPRTTTPRFWGCAGPTGEFGEAAPLPKPKLKPALSRAAALAQGLAGSWAGLRHPPGPSRASLFLAEPPQLGCVRRARFLFPFAPNLTKKQKGKAKFWTPLQSCSACCSQPCSGTTRERSVLLPVPDVQSHSKRLSPTRLLNPDPIFRPPAARQQRPKRPKLPSAERAVRQPPGPSLPHFCDENIQAPISPLRRGARSSRRNAKTRVPRGRV